MKSNTLLWVGQSLLAALFLFAGVVKLVMPIEAMTMPVALPGVFIRMPVAVGLIAASIAYGRRQRAPQNLVRAEN